MGEQRAVATELILVALGGMLGGVGRALVSTLVAGLEWLAFQPDRSLEDVLPALLRAIGAERA